jgi:hypothetical protein
MAETWKSEADILASLVVGGQREIVAQTIRDAVYSILRPEFVFFTTATPGSHVAGTAYYSGGTFNVQRDVDGVVANLPEELQTPLSSNASGVDIANGCAVYVSGSLGQKPTLELADKGDETADRVIAVATHDIDDGENGYATTFGVVRGIDASGPGAEVWAEGDELFLGDAGAPTKVRPSGSDAVVSLGRVLNNHPVSGEIFVAPRPIPPLYLDNVLIEARPLITSTSFANMEVWSWTDVFAPVGSSDKKQTELTVEAYRDTPQFKDFLRHTRDSLLFLEYQMPHSWCQTDCEFHLHLLPCAASTGDAYFTGQYFFGGINDEVPASASWTTFATAITLTGAQQYQRQYRNVVTVSAPASPGNSDVLSLFCQREGTHGSDTYTGSKDHETAEANLGLESLDLHFQQYLSGSAHEFSGEITVNSTIAVGDPDAIPGRTYIYARLLVRSGNGNAVSFRIYNETDAGVVQLGGAGGDAEILAETSTTYLWREIGPLALPSGTKRYRVQAKCDSAPSGPTDEPWCAQVRIVAR